MRTIMHIDMNAYFASVEQQSNPALRGKPVAVTGSGARTIITTASYEARAFGVKTGMPVGMAKRICPQLILVVGNNRKYTDTAAGIVKIFREFTPLVEVFSIDEAFLDVSGSLTLYGSAERIAMLIKAQIKHRYGLTCSVGIAPNKLLAKLASEMQKPDGLTRIAADKVDEVLETMPVGELCGIGRKTRQQLELLGITTCGELGRFPLGVLRKRFGIVGARLQAMGRGLDDAPVIPAAEEEEVKSVGHSTTLPRDIDDPQEIRSWLLRLSEMVGQRARRYRMAGRTVTLTVRYADFTTFSVRHTGSDWLSHSDAVYRAAVTLLDGLTLAQPVRLLGVTLSSLRQEVQQYSLFEEDRRAQQVAEAVDTVNSRYGGFAVTYASTLERENASKVISPAWRPEGVKNVEMEE